MAMPICMRMPAGIQSASKTPTADVLKTFALAKRLQLWRLERLYGERRRSLWLQLTAQ